MVMQYGSIGYEIWLCNVEVTGIFSFDPVIYQRESIFMTRELKEITKDKLYSHM